jgi:hypothetical protein
MGCHSPSINPNLEKTMRLIASILACGFAATLSVSAYAGTAQIYRHSQPQDILCTSTQIQVYGGYLSATCSPSGIITTHSVRVSVPVSDPEAALYLPLLLKAQLPPTGEIVGNLTDANLGTITAGMNARLLPSNTPLIVTYDAAPSEATTCGPIGTTCSPILGMKQP